MLFPTQSPSGRKAWTGSSGKKLAAIESPVEQVISALYAWRDAKGNYMSNEELDVVVEAFDRFCETQRQYILLKRQSASENQISAAESIRNEARKNFERRMDQLDD